MDCEFKIRHIDKQTNEELGTHIQRIVQITRKQKGSCNADQDLDEKFKQYYMENVNSRHTSAEGLTNRRSNSAHTLRRPISSSQGNDDDGSELAFKTQQTAEKEGEESGPVLDVCHTLVRGGYGSPV